MKIKKEELVKLFNTYRDEYGFSGSIMIKSKDNDVLSYSAGYANRMYHIENERTTSFDTASITKVFTAAGIVLLESQGLISFEDDIHSIVDLQGTKIPKDVKIKHLLTHTSGIADDAEEEKGEDYSALFVDSPNYAIRENKDFIKNFAYKEPNFKAGEDICYNNCAFVLLGLAIENITKQSYRDFITKEIFEAFHMKNTFFAAKEDSDKPFAEGYYYDDNGTLKKNIYLFPPIGTADGGAYTSVEDLDIFIRTVSSSDVFKKMLEPQTELKKPNGDSNYTVGFGFELFEQDGQIIRAHKDGYNAGVCDITVYYPKEELTCSILGNVDCDIWAMMKEVEEIMNDRM